MKKIFSFNKQIAFMTFRRFIKRLEKKSRKKSKVFRNKNKKYLSRNVNKNKRLNKFSSKKKIVKFNRIKKKKFNKLSLRAVKNRRRLLLRKKRKIFRLRNNFIRIYKHSIHHFKKYSRINKRSTSDKVCIKNLYFYNKYRSLLFIKRKRIKLSKFNLKKIKLKLFSNKELFSKKYFLKKYYRFFQKILSEYSLNKENKISFYNYNLNGLYEFKNIIKKSFKNKKISKNRNVKLKVHKKSKNDLTKDQNRKFLVHQKIYLKVLKLYLERMLLCYLKDTNIKVNIQNFSYTKVYAEVQKQVKLILIANKFSKYKVIRRKNFRHILFIICLAFHLQKPYLITNYIALLLQRIRRHKMVCFMIFDIIEYLKLYYTGYNAIRLEVCGRFGGQNKRKRLILQTKESNLNSHTFSVPLYYSFAESYTFCGVFGIKLWMSHKVIDRKQKQEANQLILNTIIRES